MQGESNTPSALGFLRVLDLSESIAGQFCCRMLADYGAEVILIEPPDGSVTRSMGPFRETAARDSVLFFHLNHGKTSVVVDQTTQDGQTLLRDLAAKADVLVVPKGADRAALRKASPNCIIETVSPFGEDGPMKDWKGSEMIYQAMSGMMIHNGRKGGEPLYGAGQRASFCAGVGAYIGVLGALMARERQGIAQDLAVDIAQVSSAMTYPFALQYSYNKSFEPRGDRGQPLIEVKCADGYIAIWIRPVLFGATCEALGAPHLIDDVRFKDANDRKANFHEFIAEVQKLVADKSGADIVNALQARRGVAGCCFFPSQLGPEAPHLKVRNFWQTIETSDGKRLALGPQFRLSRTPRGKLRPAPALGEGGSRKGAA